MRAGLALLLSLLAVALAAPVSRSPAGPLQRRPQCSEASHATLKVQAGRDVCGATVIPNAGPVAVGFLPTACPRDAPELVVDADGPADVCRGKATAPRTIQRGHP